LFGVVGLGGCWWWFWGVFFGFWVGVVVFVWFWRVGVWGFFVFGGVFLGKWSGFFLFERVGVFWARQGVGWVFWGGVGGRVFGGGGAEGGGFSPSSGRVPPGSFPTEKKPCRPARPPKKKKPFPLCLDVKKRKCKQSPTPFPFFHLSRKSDL